MRGRPSRKITSAEAEQLAKLRKAGLPRKEIAERMGLSHSMTVRFTREVFELGLLSEDEAFGWRGKPKKPAKGFLHTGRCGDPIHNHLTIEECHELASITERGGFAGYNEFLARLFREYLSGATLPRFPKK